MQMLNIATLRVTVSLICQREVLNLDDFQFSYFDMDLQER